VELRDNIEEFNGRGVRLVGITPEDKETNATQKAELEVPFELLADTELTTIRDYGLYHVDEPKGRHLPYPTTYLIDTEGRLRWRYVGTETRDRPTLDDLRRAMERLEAPV
jgi:peroxiredoxin